jgi:DNA-binding response OmpR family regulator
VKLPKLPGGSSLAPGAQHASPAAPLPAGPDADQPPTLPPQQPTILLIEDNNDLRHFIAESFGGKFTVMEADNGEAGLSIAFQQVPDLVISDIMLPGIDGLEVCRQLKADARTSHIPVILLTAKATPEQQVTGMHSGADAYITKPFSIQLLDLQVGNLLASRAAMRQRYVHQVTLEPRQIEITNADEEFLNRVIESIENNMDHPDFGVHMLRAEMAMSLTVLYKKIHALTGMSVNEFIKSIRLKKAALLLKQSDLNVSEIAYKVGFNDRKYFSREFKKQFGKTPSEYASEA